MILLTLNKFLSVRSVDKNMFKVSKIALKADRCSVLFLTLDRFWTGHWGIKSFM